MMLQNDNGRGMALEREIGARMGVQGRQLHLSQNGLAEKFAVCFQQAQKYECGARSPTRSRRRAAAAP